MQGTLRTGLSPKRTSEFFTSRPIFSMECSLSNCWLSASNCRNFAAFVSVAESASYDCRRDCCVGLGVFVRCVDFCCQHRQHLGGQEPMEHTNELRALHSNQRLATLRSEHGVDQVQINAGHKVRFPAVDAVVVRRFSCAFILNEAEVVLMAASLNSAVGLRDPQAA